MFDVRAAEGKGKTMTRDIGQGIFIILQESSHSSNQLRAT
jgi:hypothetical protein